MSAIAAVVGRILIALLFIFSGVNKLFDLPATDAMIRSVGLPAGLALPTALFEIVAGLCVAVGFLTRLAALLLVAFTLLAILFFHRDFRDPVQGAMAMKNVAIAGGLLCLFAYGHMRGTYDALRARRRAERVAHAADARATRAELHTARAEGRAEAAGAPVAVRKRPFWRR